MARQLTVDVTGGALGLDDGKRLAEELERATGVTWQLAPAADDGHLSGGIVEIVLVAVLEKSTELAYAAVLDKARERIERWRRERLDKPDYTIDADAEVGGTGDSYGESELPEDFGAEA